jgi:hypothetical protein
LIPCIVGDIESHAIFRGALLIHILHNLGLSLSQQRLSNPTPIDVGPVSNAVTMQDHY